MPNALRYPSLAVLLGGFAAGCQEPIDPPGKYPATLQLSPTIETVAAPVPPIDQVRIRIGRPPAESVLDTTVAFPAGTAPLNLRLRVALQARSERLGVSVDLLSGGQVYYSGLDTVLVVALGSGPAAAPNLVLRYVGPGATIRTLRIAPRDSTLTLNDPITFRLTAQDAAGAPVTNFPVTWSTTDPQVPVSQTGALVAPPRRVTIKVAVVIPTGLVDTVALTFVPKAVAVGLVSGGGQSGRPSSPLTVPFGVVVKAADSLPMAGVPVRFRAGAGGGSVRDSVVSTNSQGQAVTVMTLGGQIGPNRYDAEVIGLPIVSVTNAGTAGPAARLLYQSGGAQVARVNTPQAEPLVVLVTDRDGFPVRGEKVSWAAVAGGGQVAAATSSTDAEGLASVATTTGPLRGLTLIRATIPIGPATQASVTFPSFGIAGPANSLQVFSGNGGAAFLPATLRVRLSDALGNPALGTTVSWTFASGTGALSAGSSVTGPDGLASVGYSPTASLDVAVRAATGSLSTTFSLAANPAATGFVPIAGIDQTGFVTQQLENDLVVSVTDFGSAVVGASVTWQILEGGGGLSSAATVTNSDGAASISYTAGTRAGVVRVQARHAASGLVANFSATVGPGDPVVLLPASGDNQSAPPGTTAPLPLRILVVDFANNPVPGVVIDWVPLDGGTVGSSTATTDQFGVAATTVRLGAGLGPKRFAARYFNEVTTLSATFIVTAK